MNDQNNPAAEQEMHNAEAIMTIVLSIGTAIFVGLLMQEPVLHFVQAMGS